MAQKAGSEMDAQARQILSAAEAGPSAGKWEVCSGRCGPRVATTHQPEDHTAWGQTDAPRSSRLLFSVPSPPPRDS